MPLAGEDIIDSSYHRYMRKLIGDDLSVKLQNTTEELEQILILEALVTLTARDDAETHKRYRTLLARLKKKHRAKIKQQRKKILDQFA